MCFWQEPWLFAAPDDLQQNVIARWFEGFFDFLNSWDLLESNTNDFFDIRMSDLQRTHFLFVNFCLLAQLYQLLSSHFNFISIESDGLEIGKAGNQVVKLIDGFDAWMAMIKKIITARSW